MPSPPKKPTQNKTRSKPNQPTQQQQQQQGPQLWSSLNAVVSCMQLFWCHSAQDLIPGTSTACDTNNSSDYEDYTSY